MANTLRQDLRTTPGYMADHYAEAARLLESTFAGWIELSALEQLAVLADFMEMTRKEYAVEGWGIPFDEAITEYARRIRPARITAYAPCVLNNL